MIRVLVMSDSHHNYGLMGTVLKREKDIQVLIHLGDEHDDVDHFSELTDKINIITVPGLYHQDYINYPKRRCIEFSLENHIFQISHSPKDLILTNKNVEIFMHGHTHISNIIHQGDQTILNPGHLKTLVDRSHTASYMIMEVERERILVKLIDINNSIMKTELIGINEI